MSAFELGEQWRTERRDHQKRPQYPDGVALVSMREDWRGWRVSIEFIPAGMYAVLEVGRHYHWAWMARRGARRVARRLEAHGYAIRTTT